MGVGHAWVHIFTSSVSFLTVYIIHFLLRKVIPRLNTEGNLFADKVIDKFNWKMGGFMLIFAGILFLTNFLLAGLYTHPKVAKDCDKEDAPGVKGKYWTYALIPGLLSIFGNLLATFMPMIPFIGPVLFYLAPLGPLILAILYFALPFVQMIPYIGPVVSLVTSFLGKWIFALLGIPGWGIWSFISALISSAALEGNICD